MEWIEHEYNEDPESWVGGTKGPDDYYEDAVWGEPIPRFVGSIFRSMTEWDLIEQPMTKDDVLDTMLWIQRLP